MEEGPARPGQQQGHNLGGGGGCIYGNVQAGRLDQEGPSVQS